MSSLKIDDTSNIVAPVKHWTCHEIVDGEQILPDFVRILMDQGCPGNNLKRISIEHNGKNILVVYPEDCTCE